MGIAFAQPALGVFGGEVDVDNLIGLGEHGIRKPFADLHAQQALDGVVQALDVLHVERADDVDAGGENLLNILVTFGVTAVGGVGVGKLVEQRALALAG